MFKSRIGTDGASIPMLEWSYLLKIDCGNQNELYVLKMLASKYPNEGRGPQPDSNNFIFNIFQYDFACTVTLSCISELESIFKTQLLYREVFVLSSA